MVMSYQDVDEILADVVLMVGTTRIDVFRDRLDQRQGHLDVCFRVQAHSDPGYPCGLGQGYSDVFQQAPCVFCQPGQRDSRDDQLTHIFVKLSNRTLNMRSVKLGFDVILSSDGRGLGRQQCKLENCDGFFRYFK